MSHLSDLYNKEYNAKWAHLSDLYNKEYNAKWVTLVTGPI